MIKDERVVAVFALTRVGNLIVQTDRNENYTDSIIDACTQENIPFHGVVGDWILAKPLWDCARQKIPALQDHACIKAILYSANPDGVSPNHAEHKIKYLELSDYAAWDQLNRTSELEHR